MLHLQTTFHNNNSIQPKMKTTPTGPNYQTCYFKPASEVFRTLKEGVVLGVDVNKSVSQTLSTILLTSNLCFSTSVTSCIFMPKLYYFI